MVSEKDSDFEDDDHISAGEAVSDLDVSLGSSRW